MLLHIANR